MNEESRRPLPGSERAPAVAASAVGAVDPGAAVDVTVVLRRRAEPPPELVNGPATLDRVLFAQRYGAAEADAELVHRVLSAAGLAVSPTDLASRRMLVSGTAAQLSAAFGTSLELVSSPDPVTGEPVQHRHRTGGLSLPAELDGAVVAVLGLDDRPQARAQFRPAGQTPGASFTPPQLGQVYRFPPATDGTGQTIAIVELGGGYAQADLDAYFAGLGLATPAVASVGVDGAVNGGGHDPHGADGEVLLDIQVAGALAPRATLTVYFAPNTDRGFLDAVSGAVHAAPTPTAVSISWGQSEDGWTPQARTALDQAFIDAAALGVTVCAAAGDNGSTDGVTDGAQHVDFPASSPHALACGGTSLQVASASTPLSETVWNDGSGATGGGVSDAFTAPAWQTGVGVPARVGGGSGRGVPDVAGDADPATGYQVLVDGQPMVIGGTSAVAPLWAALTARLGQGLGRPLGLLAPMLYTNAKPGTSPAGFRDIVTGSNGAYNAAAGWDPCTGLGVPDGEQLLAALRTGQGT